ncbi:MAG TPA: hypothetical protein VFC19_34640 [Candidatus Limnocylindrales bacterium]|nr:hypothetical protein [Candidatus Limnocylindrales bacterium]
MRAKSAADRAAMWLGAASLLSLLFLVIKRELHFVDVPKAGVPVAIVLGLVAVAGGSLANRVLVVLAGIGFLAAAAGQVVLQTAGSSLADGSSGSTCGFWLGLGAGLLALGLKRS